jgi:hypothetical protein
VTDEAGGTLRDALLDLGLEDWIPIPEAVGDPEVIAAAASSDVAAKVAAELKSLLIDGKVRLYRGPWNGESEPVSTPEALDLLTDSKWFTYRLDDPNEVRLYFVNVDNIAGE